MAVDKQEAFIADEESENSGDSIVNAKQASGTSDTLPNKDQEFMEKYQIEDNILYTVFSAPSRYMKIVVLTYMMYGGVPVKQKAQTLISYIVFGVCLVLLRSNAGTYSSLLSVIVAASLSTLLFFVIGVNDIEDEEVESASNVNEDYIGIDISRNKEKENDDNE